MVHLLFASVYPRVASLWDSKDYPAFSFHFPVKAMGFQMYASSPGITWLLEIQTKDFTLVQQSPSPLALGKNCHFRCTVWWDFTKEKSYKHHRLTLRYNIANIHRRSMWHIIIQLSPFFLMPGNHWSHFCSHSFLFFRINKILQYVAFFVSNLFLLRIMFEGHSCC